MWKNKKTSCGVTGVRLSTKVSRWKTHKTPRVRAFRVGPWILVMRRWRSSISVFSTGLHSGWLYHCDSGREEKPRTRHLESRRRRKIFRLSCIFRNRCGLCLSDRTRSFLLFYSFLRFEGSCWETNFLWVSVYGRGSSSVSVETSDTVGLFLLYFSSCITQSIVTVCGEANSDSLLFCTFLFLFFIALFSFFIFCARFHIHFWFLWKVTSIFRWEACPIRRKIAKMSSFLHHWHKRKGREEMENVPRFCGKRISKRLEELCNRISHVLLRSPRFLIVFQSIINIDILISCCTLYIYTLNELLLYNKIFTFNSKFPFFSLFWKFCGKRILVFDRCEMYSTFSSQRKCNQ